MTQLLPPSPAQNRAAYRAAAITGARQAIAALERKHVKALVTGSLADNSFDLHSDVDILITQCPREMKYAIEAIVEDALGTIPFDVIYLDEIAPRKLRSFTEKARRVEDLD
jgi:predicted nucleotidyltransferase